MNVSFIINIVGYKQFYVNHYLVFRRYFFMAQRLLPLPGHHLIHSDQTQEKIIFFVLKV